jgi:ribonuclease J
MGGAEEVGRNMTMVEYGEDIILIDCGLQFPEEDQPGIDYIIPNISYLKGKERNVKGIIITHAHYDHIGGIPHIAPELHNPPIYGTRLTMGIIKKRQEDFPDKGALDLREINPDETLHLGQFRVEFFRVNHNIPDCVGIIVRTPEGTIVHTGDFKFDYTPVMDKVTEFSKIAKLGDEGVLALCSDSTNADTAGQQLSESAIGDTLDQIFQHAKGRLIIGTFASLLTRVQQVIWAAEKYGRRVAIEGYSMKTNVAICKELGYLKFHPKTIVSAEEATSLPENRLVIMCTGAQGEGNAALMRIAAREHRFFRIQPNDTVIFSSSVVPGNERTVQRLKDTLVKAGAEVIHYKMMDVHAGGHAMSEDLKLLYRLVKPKYIIPIEGNAFMLQAAGNVAKTLGWPKEQVILTENGQVIEFCGGEARPLKKKLTTDYVMVDGLGVGDVSNVVLRDRQVMSEDGMFVIIATVDAKTGALIGSPDIISRGFVYMKGNKTLIEEAREKVKKVCVDKNPKDAANPMYLKNKLRDEIGQFLFHKTQRRPMILPVVIEV